jgi:hypothetical protein
MTSPFHCLLLVAILLAGTLAASAQELTVMELLQNRRQFEGRRVTVSGYYYSDFEGHEIFADLKAANAHDTKRAIWIEADPIVESPIRKGRICGVFFYSRNYQPKEVFSGFGIWGLYSSALINCTVHLQGPAIPAPNQTMQRTPTRRSRHISND